MVTGDLTTGLELASQGPGATTWALWDTGGKAVETPIPHRHSPWPESFVNMPRLRWGVHERTPRVFMKPLVGGGE